MSIKAKAVRVVNETYADKYVAPHMTPLKVVQALADAGLLAPEPADPFLDNDGAHVWRPVSCEDAEIWFQDGELNLDGVEDYIRSPSGATPANFRRVAAALLSAAAFAEDQENKND